MITKDYIKMCSSTKELQDIFFLDGEINKNMLPSFICINSKVYLVTNYKGKLMKIDFVNSKHKIMKEFNNIIWLPTIEQMIVLYKKYCVYSNNMLGNSDLIILSLVNDFHIKFIEEVKDKDDDVIIYASKLNMNQLFLLFLLHELYDIHWNIINQSWIKRERKEH